MKKKTKKELKEKGAELYKWIGVLERYPQLYSGEFKRGLEDGNEEYIKKELFVDE